MKLFHFHNPRDNVYAQAGLRGTWHPEPSPGLCPECGSPRQRIVPPLVIEWLPDSDVIGDFTWASFDEYIVVSPRVHEAFEARFWGIRFGPVEMVQDANLRRPKRATIRTKARVWLPYSGPALWHLQAPTEAQLDLQKSGYAVRKICSVCGTVFYNVPPYEQRHLVVDPSTWSSAPIFWMGDSAGAIYCTEEVKAFVEEAGFTNVTFLEDGIIPA